MLRILLLSLVTFTLVACGGPTEADPNDNNDPGEDPSDENPSDEDPADEDPIDEPVACTYPAGGLSQPSGIGDMLPNISWGNVTFPDGSEGPFSLEAFYCDEAYAQYDTMTVVLVTTWCPNCPGYVQQTASMSNALESNNNLLVYGVMQNSNYQRATAATADSYISGYAGAGTGIRIGDVETQPQGALDYMYTFIPNGFVVRKSDMTVIAHQETAGNFLPYVDIAADPTNDWSSGLAPFVNQCGDTDDEVYEPNNSPEQAATLGFGEFQGGICDQQADIYYLDVQGDWRIDLLFSHNVGDIDLHLINQAGESQQQAWSTTDNEEMEGSGPALIAVVGYTGASAPYTFILSER